MANYTLNYTGEKVDELLNKIDTAFGETTVMGDTLTWDGNTDGKVFVDAFGNGQQLFCLVSDVVPTIEDFTNGAKLGFGANGEIEIPASGVLPLGDGVLVESNFNFGIIPRDNMTVTVPYNGMTLSVTYPKKGIYFGKTVGVGYVSSLTINGYTGFEMVEITPIETKYLGGDYDIVFTAEDLNTDEPTATCNKIFAELKAMPLERLRTAVVKCNTETSVTNLESVMPIVAVSKMTATNGTSSALIFAFNYTDSYQWRHYAITVQGDNIGVQKIS